MGQKVISIVNQKGGTGKTTTTINLSAGLARLKRKVLLIDLDPQTNLTYSLAVTDFKYTIADVISGACAIEEAIIKTGNIWTIPGSEELADIEISLVKQKNREEYLQESLKEIKGFDYVLIDSPPSLSVLTVNALNAANSVLVPLQVEVLTLQGLNQILRTVGRVKTTINPNLEIAGILLVNYDQRRKLSKEVKDYISDNINEHLFKTVIRSNVSVAEAPSFGKSVIDYKPSSHGAEDYLSFAREFDKHLKKVYKTTAGSKA